MMETPAPCPVCVRRQKWMKRLVNLAVVGFALYVVHLIMPPFAKVRVAAARMTSSNNLKQMTVAMHTYDEYNFHLTLNQA